MKSETKAWKRVLKDPTFRSFGGIILVIVIVSVLLAIRNPNFMTTSNILNILRQISVYGILAAGMTFVIITGGIDLSVGRGRRYGRRDCGKLRHKGHHALPSRGSCCAACRHSGRFHQRLCRLESERSALCHDACHADFPARTVLHRLRGQAHRQSAAVHAGPGSRLYVPAFRRRSTSCLPF